MLYNKNKWNPGKYVIQNNIKNLYNNCNAELFLRYILYECDIPALKTNKDVCIEDVCHVASDVMGHEMLIGVSIQTGQTISFSVAHLAVVDGITYMDGK